MGLNDSYIYFLPLPLKLSSDEGFLPNLHLMHCGAALNNHIYGTNCWLTIKHNKHNILYNIPIAYQNDEMLYSLKHDPHTDVFNFTSLLRVSLK